MKISEVKPKQGGISLEFDVVEKGSVREFSKFGKTGKVCTATVRDDSGSVKLSLWNEDCDRINEGDKVKLTDGYANEYQGEIQLTSGRMGKLEVLGKGAAPKAAEVKPAAKSAPAKSVSATSKPGYGSKKGLDTDDTAEEPKYDEDHDSEDSEDSDFDDDVDEEFVD
jgi:replication factor A1